MIFTATVIDGFKVILGSLPLQLAMMITILTSVSVPRDDNDEMDPTAKGTYLWLCIVHLAMFVQIFFNMYVNLNPVANVVLMLVQVVTQIFLCVNWVYNPNLDPDWLTAGLDEDWTKFLFWIRIEVFVFIGYMACPILFSVIRSIVSEKITMTTPATT